MTSTRIWVIGGAVAIIAVLAGGWFLGVSPFLSAAAASDIELASVEQANDEQQARIDTLSAASDKLPQLQDELQSLSDSIPQSASLSTFVGDLSALAEKAGVSIASLTVNDALLLSDAAAQAAAAAPAPPTTEAPAEGESTAPAPTEDAPAGVAPAVSADVPGMVAIPITLSAVGSFEALESFISAFQKSGRFASISGLVFSQDTTTGSFRLDLTAAVYVLPLS